jgi:signal transduction histidine kinase
MKLRCQSFIAICYLLICFHQHSFGQSPIDSAKNIIQRQYKDEKTYLRTCFFIADEYMNIEQYDSAQLWLNKIHELLPLKTNSLNNYLLITRQAEVYYYNNLQQLGLQESRRGLAMAETLRDSLLLADSYNFLGLFYMNIDSAAASIQYYKKGLLYTKQPPYPEKYLSLTKPHHLHGNLAEAYYKLKKYDSALYHNQLSLQKASAINWERGVAVAMHGLADVLFEQNRKDSAFQYYQAGVNTATKSNDVDVALVCYSGMAKCYHAAANTSATTKKLAEGFVLLQQRPNINRFYAVHFLNTAIDIYRKQNNNAGLVRALELKSSIEKAVINGNNQQIQTILNAGLANEKRIVSMQLEEAKQKQELANTRFMMALIGFAFLGIGFLVYRYYQNQKLAVSKMRQKISQDLHDDIGASLSSLQIYGTIAEQSIENNPAKAIEMVNKISYQSKEILENMNDIVWSMKNNSTSNTSLEIKIKNYAVGLLSDNNIQFTYNMMQQADDVITGITARKNILLIAKEAMNNIAKYSKAANASLSLQMNGKELLLLIHDDGIGFTTDTVKNGNGLENMEQRTKELNGIFHIQSSPGAGTTVTASFPLTGIH